ncbi:hypothetical protein BDF22DRAFT_730611 [Syncephalis plumigaleata]|nr:hypothetical protein BDF22DRAFT_730611 [Syncephalis plumigaleata]
MLLFIKLPGLFATVLGDGKSGTTPINDYFSLATNQFDGRLRRRNLIDTDINGLAWLLRSSSMRVRTGAIFSRLTELDLSRNRLTTLPDGLCRAMPSLTKLNLAHNRIAQCPLSLAHLTSLEELNLTGNQLGATADSLPGWLFRRWPQLRVLRLSDNQLEKLPNELVQLTLLEVLELGSVLGGNRLRGLPAGCLVRLRNLVDLDLTGNQLTELDLNDDIYHHHHHHHHYHHQQHVSANAIDANDETSTILPALNYLTLTDNQITSLPAALAECSQLRSLRVDGNRLTSLPSQLVDLANLELLDVARNQLSVWPAELDELAQRGCTVILAQNPFDKQHESIQNRPNNNGGRQSPVEIRALSMLPAVMTETTRPITAHATISSNIHSSAHQHDSYHHHNKQQQQHNSSSSNVDNNGNTMMSGIIGNGPPSLLELTARVLLRSQQPIPYHALPDHLVAYLSGGAHACAWCHGPFVGEWIGCLRQGHFGGHGVHRWLRYCSRSCQSSAAEEASRIAFTNMSHSSKHHRRIYAQSSEYNPRMDDDSWCDPMACAPVGSTTELSVSIDTETTNSPVSSPMTPSLSTESPMPGAAPYSPLAIFLESRKRKSAKKASRLRCDTRYLDW